MLQAAQRLLRCWGAPGLPSVACVGVLDALACCAWLRLVCRANTSEHQGVVQSGQGEVPQGFLCAHQNPAGFVALPAIWMYGRIATSLFPSLRVVSTGATKVSVQIPRGAVHRPQLAAVLMKSLLTGDWCVKYTAVKGCQTARKIAEKVSVSPGELCAFNSGTRTRMGMTAKSTLMVGTGLWISATALSAARAEEEEGAANSK